MGLRAGSEALRLYSVSRISGFFLDERGACVVEGLAEPTVAKPKELCVIHNTFGVGRFSEYFWFQRAWLGDLGTQLGRKRLTLNVIVPFTQNAFWGSVTARHL